MRYRCYYTEEEEEIKFIRELLKSLNCRISDLYLETEQMVFLAIDLKDQTSLFCFDVSDDSASGYLPEIAQATPITFQDIKIIAFDLATGGTYK